MRPDDATYFLHTRHVSFPFRPIVYTYRYIVSTILLQYAVCFLAPHHSIFQLQCFSISAQIDFRFIHRNNRHVGHAFLTVEETHRSTQQDHFKLSLPNTFGLSSDANPRFIGLEKGLDTIFLEIFLVQVLEVVDFVNRRSRYCNKLP